MENKRVWSIIRTIILSVQLVMELLSAVVILRLNMLPDKYIAVFIATLAVLALITGLLMFIRVKDQIGLWRKIVSCILSLLVICGCVLISKIAWDAHSFVSGVAGGDETPTVRNTYVLVLNEDTAHALADTKGYSYAAVENYDTEHTQQMISAIEKEITATLTLKYYKQATALVDALYNKEVNAVIMNGASISLLIEQAGYEDFLTRARLLYTLPFEDDTNLENTDKEGTVKEALTRAPFVVYISGSDTRSKMLAVSRSDVNILAVVNPQTKQVLLLNTPRDYYVPNPAGKGALDKLTHCGNYGVSCSVEALGDLYNVQINYYGQINFTGFEKLIDAIGGVTVYSDESFRTVSGTYIKAGENQLNGEKALQFARERYNVSGGDNARGKNQMKVIKAVIEKLTSSTTLISKYADILDSLEGMFATNFTTDEISSLVKMQLDDMASWNIQSFAVTGTGGYAETYSWPGEQLYVMRPNEDTVAYASKLIQKVLDGETLSTEDMTMPK